MGQASGNRFERRRVLTSWALVVAGAVLVLAIAELGLRLAGARDLVLYDRDPSCGYRPRPNQVVTRPRGATVRTNNLGLRALGDWDGRPDGKVLFLGDSVTYGGTQVPNEGLFAVLAVPERSGWVGGSGGVNGWGVENVHGLVVKGGFLPARVYVTVLLEDDFGRGFQRGEAFPTRPPRLALLVMPQLLAALPGLLRPAGETAPRPIADAAAQRANVGRAAALLAELDHFLRERGFVHLVYISPYLGNLLGTAPPDPLVAEAIRASGLRVIRLQDRLGAMGADEARACYRDAIHLTAHGHARWASAMRADLLAAGVGR